MATPTLTPIRLLWLQKLAEARGEVPQNKLPKRNGVIMAVPDRFTRRNISGNPGSVTNATWRPMVEAGWIESRYGQRHFTEQHDRLFKITDAGREVLRLANERGTK